MSIKGLKKDQYDVVIIGAGIGGLACGCYLAKAGLKVLIVEKNPKVGGYCTSFTRKGFRFDSCVHYIGSCREGGLLDTIFKELGLKIELLRIDPSDIIITPEFEIPIYRDVKRTISVFQEKFPKEAENIKKFFNNVIMKENFVERYIFLKKYSTFWDLLSTYFKDHKLKTILGGLAANLGLTAKEVTAMAMVTLYKEFLLDGGYYPLGGMQILSNILIDRFKQYGGTTIFMQRVKKIVINKNNAEGIILEDGDYISARYVVSNADAMHTLTELISLNELPNEFVKKLQKKVPSISALIVYLGIKKNIKNESKRCCGLWYLSCYDINQYYFDITHNSALNGPIFCTIPSFYDHTCVPSTDADSLRLIVGASFKDKNYWLENKIKLSDIAIRRAEKILPGLTNYIYVKDIATPQTLYRYTLNNKGAIYGWASIPVQSDEIITYKTPIKNLFLSSQWVSFLGVQGGISMVGVVGRNVSRAIIKNWQKIK